MFATPSAKAQFIVPKGINNAHTANSAETQVLLNSGRSRDQWHTMTRTGHIASLRASIPEPIIQLHPNKLASLSLNDGDLVRINVLDDMQADSAAQNKAMARVVSDEDMPANIAFMSMHWSAPVFIG
ncbi:molybdopterin dinucleotide binding domain-containing protein [Shewanella phaeophyticola]|uniref:Molybdopterin dinucleotide-binding domain-containing protein n=1 Tax=Shewanella phaeophyticola TaxID=2978345 RepID=A0ABT2P0F7_9GAMM|nr:molybdopterin dinucleotide binding domain-containing protein [Shewanella sp. KJ10-1]MCT8986124.1 hypothetical protein [Shewanella sp. KJ10-1]